MHSVVCELTDGIRWGSKLLEFHAILTLAEGIDLDGLSGGSPRVLTRDLTLEDYRLRDSDDSSGGKSWTALDSGSTASILVSIHTLMFLDAAPLGRSSPYRNTA